MRALRPRWCGCCRLAALRDPLTLMRSVEAFKKNEYEKSRNYMVGGSVDDWIDVCTDSERSV